MTPSLIDITAAPWGTILTFVCGYVGYHLANVGDRTHHKTLDQLFIVLLYGFFGVFAYTLFRAYFGINVLVASVVGVVFSAFLGFVWRKYLCALFEKYIVRGSGLSLSDDRATAWAALSQNTNKFMMTQLTVFHTDGTRFFCNNLHDFRNAPDGPCILGGVGDVMMYATHVGKPQADGSVLWGEQSNVFTEEYGFDMTYIPREQILRIKFRRIEGDE